MAELPAPISDFNRRFKRDFAELFAAPEANFQAIQLQLMDMIKYIGGGFKLPKRIRRELEHIEHEVFAKSLNIVGKIDASQNPAAYFRTSINREFLAQFEAYKDREMPSEEIEDGTRPQPIDPAAVAREYRDAPSFRLTDLRSKILVMQGIDAEIDRLLRQFRESSDYDLIQGIESAIFGLQKMRMIFAGEYYPSVVGNRKFSATNFIMFAPRIQE